MSEKPTYKEQEQRTKNPGDTVLESKQSGALSLSGENPEIKDALDFLQCLDLVSQAMNKSKNLEQIVDDVMGPVFSFFECDRIWLFYPCDPDALTFEVLSEKTNPEYPGAFKTGQELPMTPEAAETIKKANASSSPVVFDPESGNKIDDVASSFSVLSQMMMTVRPYEGETWMFGMHQCSYARVWTKNEQILFKEIGSRVIEGLNNRVLLENLKKSEHKYRQIFDNIQDVYYETSLDGRIIEISPSVENMFQYTRKELIGSSLYDIYFNPEERDRLVRIVTQHQAVKDYEITVQDKDGSLMVCSIVSRLISGGQGKPIRIVGTLHDITERKKAEQALRESEELFKAMFQQSGGYGMILEPNNTGIPTILDVNEAACKAHGFKRDEIIGRPVADLDDEEGKRLCIERTKLIMSGKPLRIETNHMRKDGSVFPVEVRANLFQFADKSPLIMTTEFDISERKKAEEELQKKEEKFRGVFNQAAVGVARVDLDGTWLEVNNKLSDIVGYSQEELLSKTFQDITHPDDLQADLEYINQLLEDEIKTYSMEKRYFKKNGDIVWINLTVSLVRDINNDPVYFISIIENITERKLSEKKLRDSILNLNEAVRAGRIGLWGWDLKTKKVTYSTEWKRQIGYGDHEINDEFSEWEKRVHPDDLQSTITAVEKSIREKNQDHRTEFRFRHKDGSYRWILAQGSFVQNKEGHPVKMLGSHIDITDQKKLENKMRQSQKMESIGTLAGGIAHDFNNILSSIIGFTELALDDAEKGTSIEDSLQEIYTAGKRARDLVKQILAFARQSEESVKPVWVGPLAMEALKLIRASMPATIKIESDINSDSLVNGNATQIHQIFMNLCTNAAHAMEENGGVLSVGIRDVIIEKTSKSQDLPSGGYLLIEVSDTGTGMPAEVRELIFDPYFTSKSVDKGSGMGLSMVHGIVESYGGKIRVESEVGKGTTFSVYLPVMKKQGADQSPASQDLVGGTERILFVDDEAPIVNMGGQVLRRMGYQVSTHTSSLEALSLFEENPEDFDLVITDMTMPDMTGEKLAMELIKIRPDIPVILSTGFSNRMTEEIAARIGIKAFTYKPMVRLDLAKTIRKVLDDNNEKLKM